MRRVLFLAVVGGLVGCGGGGSVCNRVADLRTDCSDPPAESQVTACRTTLSDCPSEEIDLLDAYVDCLAEGVEDGECFISDPKDPSTDPSAGCFANLLGDADPACVAAVISL